MNMKKIIIGTVIAISIFFNVYLISRRLYLKYIYKAPVEIKHLDMFAIKARTRADLFKVLPQTKDDILFIGDSHIEHLELQEIFKNEKVKNRGIGGNTTQDLLNRMDEITGRKPKKIFIGIGINDLLSEIPLNIVKSNFLKIVSKIKQSTPQTKVYLISLLPTKNSPTPEYPIEKNIEDVNRFLIAVLARNGITYIDIYKEFVNNGALDKKYDCGDHLHLNADGCLRLCRILKPYL